MSHTGYRSKIASSLACILLPLLATPATAWKDFESGKGNLPDYSWSGYGYFETPLPTFTPENSASFRVEDFGARADDGRSDWESVEKAIRAAEAFTASNPDKWGIIRFATGRYDLRDPADVPRGSLTIHGDRVVLSGSGRGDGGTDLFGQAASSAPMISFQPLETEPMPNFRGKPVARIEAPNTVEDYGVFTPLYSITVKSADVANLSAYKAGEILTVVGNWQKHEKEYFLPLAPFGKGRYYILEPHEIVKIEGTRVTFREPIWAKASDLTDLFVTPTVRKGGIENLTLSGNFREKMRHYYSCQSDGFELVGTKYLRDGFFRNLRFRHGTCAINLSRSSACTVWDAAFSAHWGHMMVRSVGGSYGNFFGLIREEAPSWHGIGTSDYSVNTVMWRCSQRGGFESHGNSTFACLVDRNSGDLSLGRLGGAAPFNHRGLTHWNWFQVPYRGVHKEEPVANFESFVLPAVIGVYGDLQGLTLRGSDSKMSIFEGFGQEVDPPSLFEAQVAKRLGKLPDWVARDSRDFESMRRFTRGILASPLPMDHVSRGEPVQARFIPDPLFDGKQITKIEWLAGDRPAIERGKEEILATLTAPPWLASLRNLPSGQWFIRARMHTKYGDEFSTPEHMVRVGEFKEDPQPVADALWWQDQEPIVAPFLKAAADAVSNRAGFMASVERLFSAGPFRPDAKALFDASGTASLAANTMHRYNFQLDNRHVVHFAFPESVALSKLEVDVSFSHPGSGVEYELAVSEDPMAMADVRNRFDTWNVIARETFSNTQIERFRSKDGVLLPIYLPKQKAKYARLLIGGWMPVIESIPNTTTLLKIRPYRYP